VERKNGYPKDLWDKGSGMSVLTFRGE